MFVFALKFLVTVLISVHLAISMLAPGGRIPLIDAGPPPVFSYLTLFPRGNGVGLSEDAIRHQFLFFKIYSQDGVIVEGSLPDMGAFNLLRYDRWAKVGKVVSGDFPTLHRNVLDYLLERLQNPPLKVELFSGIWQPKSGTLATMQADAKRPNSNISIELLGTYDGLNRIWSPAIRRGDI